MKITRFKKIVGEVKYYTIRFDSKGKRRAFSVGVDVKGETWNSKWFQKDVYDGVNQYGIYLGRFAFAFLNGKYKELEGQVVAPYVSK
jgi:hypothetical protein